MTEAGWTSNNDAAETYADKAAIEAVRHVLGAHKLTCDEHENLQQDFKDVAQEAHQQGRVAGLNLACIAVSQFSSDGEPIDANELRIALVQLLGELAKQ